MLPAAIEAAVAAQHGGPICVPSSQGKYVVMSMAMYREMLGLGGDEDFRQSVADLQASLAQAAAGETISLENVRKKLNDKYGS